MDDFDGGAAAVRRLPGHHLVNDRARGKDVRSSIGRLPADLLRRTVLRRANQHARGSEPRRRYRGVGAGGGGDTEIQELDAVRRQEHVRGFQIPVHNAMTMQRIDPGEHAERE